MHHRVGLRAQRLRGRKIAVEAVAQVLRLAHVDDAAVGIAETVNARVSGDFAGGGAVAGRLCHGYFLLALLGFTAVLYGVPLRRASVGLPGASQTRAYDKPRILHQAPPMRGGRCVNARFKSTRYRRGVP